MAQLTGWCANITQTEKPRRYQSRPAETLKKLRSLSVTCRCAIAAEHTI
jgi:hypothetical protein